MSRSQVSSAASVPFEAMAHLSTSRHQLQDIYKFPVPSVLRESIRQAHRDDKFSLCLACTKRLEPRLGCSCLQFETIGTNERLVCGLRVNWHSCLMITFFLFFVLKKRPQVYVESNIFFSRESVLFFKKNLTVHLKFLTFDSTGGLCHEHAT